MRILIITASALCVGLAGPSFAQKTVGPPPDPEAIQKELEARAKLIPMGEPVLTGLPAEREIESQINWGEVEAMTAETEKQDAAASGQFSQTSVLTSEFTPRPRGLRKASPRIFKRVVALEAMRPKLPVLAPQGAEFISDLQVFGQDNSYSAIATLQNGASLRISGARRRIVVGDQRSARVRFEAMKKSQQILPAMNAPFLVSHSDSSTDLSFSRFGAGYVISVSCDDPDNDTRCSEDQYLIDIASNLVVLNSDQGEE